MLVDFLVTNYRSIGREMKLSMVAGAPAAKRYGASYHTGNSLAPDILVAAAVFGANGAGKSTVIKALKFFQDFVRRSVSLPKDGRLPHRFNKLTEDGAKVPTELELSFTHRGELFQYGFSLDRDRINSEWLYSRASKKLSRTRAIFTREYDPESETYSWYINESAVPGERETWRNSTRDNALFLTTAVELNSETLTKPYDWIVNSLHVIGASERIHPEFTAKAINESIEGVEKAEIIDFMRSLVTCSPECTRSQASAVHVVVHS
ncbi:AAA family ATPase [Nitratireductor sp.]|uniref:AAA family ATPase n=1 Tax=Nitratireductor sp. TaxID=1872084 RepID=UPI00261A2766|nr:AAA family ATPase [Nitratireductor sp.]